MQQAETLLEMGDRFKVSQSRCGIPPRLQPLIDRAFGVAGSRQVMSEQLRLSLDEIGEMPFQRRRDASYLFKHALVQDAAYSTLLRGRRQELHAGGIIAAGRRWLMLGIRQKLASTP